MKYVLKKRFTFEAAHRLFRNYTGKCNNNHGHSYVVVVSLESTELDERDMLIDFKETRTLKEWIDNCLDHSTILWEEDPLIEALQKFNQKLFITPKNPTAEQIAEVILNKAIELYQDERVKVHSIEINETCTSSIVLYA